MWSRRFNFCDILCASSYFLQILLVWFLNVEALEQKKEVAFKILMIHDF